MVTRCCRGFERLLPQDFSETLARSAWLTGPRILRSRLEPGTVGLGQRGLQQLVEHQCGFLRRSSTPPRISSTPRRGRRHRIVPNPEEEAKRACTVDRERPGSATDVVILVTAGIFECEYTTQSSVLAAGELANAAAAIFSTSTQIRNRYLTSSMSATPATTRGWRSATSPATPRAGSPPATR